MKGIGIGIGIEIGNKSAEGDKRTGWLSGIVVAAAVILPLAMGCDTAAEPAAATTDAGKSDTTADAITSCPFTNAAAGASTIVINELQAKGDDWVELHNKGAATVSLAGYTLADQDEFGCPDLADGVTFPADATIAAGGYILVEAGKKTPEIGQTTKCIPGGPETCYQAKFKISAESGDKVFLTLNKTLVDSASVPPNVLLDGTKTWGRLPNGTGGFKSAEPTPGAANK